MAAPQWLTTKAILGRASDDPARQSANYRSHVQNVLRQGADGPVGEVIRSGLAIGSAEFVKRVKQVAHAAGVSRDANLKRTVSRRASWQDVVRAVEQVKGEHWSEFHGRRSDPGGALGMWLARNYAGMTLREIGAAAGGKDYAAVSIAVRRFVERAKEEPSLTRLRQKCEDLLNV